VVLKLLVLYQARDAARDHPGYHEGFCRLVAEGALEAHRAIPYYGVSEEQGWDWLWRFAYEAARDMEADAIFLHFFHGGAVPRPFLGYPAPERIGVQADNLRKPRGPVLAD